LSHENNSLIFLKEKNKHPLTSSKLHGDQRNGKECIDQKFMKNSDRGIILEVSGKIRKQFEENEKSILRQTVKQNKVNSKS